VQSHHQQPHRHEEAINENTGNIDNINRNTAHCSGRHHHANHHEPRAQTNSNLNAGKKCSLREHHHRHHHKRGQQMKHDQTLALKCAAVFIPMHSQNGDAELENILTHTTQPSRFQKHPQQTTSNDRCSSSSRNSSSI